MAETFKCAMCGGEFEKEHSDEEAMAEMVQAFGPTSADQPLDVVCDDCYRMICPGGKPLSQS